MRMYSLSKSTKQVNNVKGMRPEIPLNNFQIKKMMRNL
jgi:hypothetical protein